MLKIGIELLSSALTLSGQFAGSTTKLGAVIYVFGGVVWAFWMIRYRQWGFLPINVIGSVISAWNLWVAF